MAVRPLHRFHVVERFFGRQPGSAPPRFRVASRGRDPLCAPRGRGDVRFAFGRRVLGDSGSGGSIGAGLPGPPSAGLTTAGARIATVRSLKVTAGKILANVDGPATFTVRIRRLVTVPRRDWRLLRTTSLAAATAGVTTIPLPQLGPGRYRLNVHLDGMPEGESFVRRLTVAPDRHP